jgi:glucan-binding YG repeat protein
MKLVGMIGTAVLSLTLGAAAPVYAQEEHSQQEDKKVQQEKPAQQEEKKAQEEKKPQQEKPAPQEEKKAQQQEEKKPQQEKPAVQHEQQAQRASGNQGRIPDDRYKANFGREHTFRVTQGDFNNHRFQYGGYWFGFAAPWPGNWLYTQDVFVVDIDGVYYLCNPIYPGVNVELIVTL